MTWKYLQTLTILLLSASLTWASTCTAGASSVTSVMLDQQVIVTYRDSSCQGSSYYLTTDSTQDYIYNPVTLFDLVERSSYNISQWNVDSRCNELFASDATCESGCKTSPEGNCFDSDTGNDLKDVNNYCLSYYPSYGTEYTAWSLKPSITYSATSKFLPYQPPASSTPLDGSDYHQTVPYRLVTKLAQGQFYTSNLNIVSISTPTEEHVLLQHSGEVVPISQLEDSTDNPRFSLKTTDIENSAIGCELFDYLSFSQDWPEPDPDFTTYLVIQEASDNYSLLELELSRVQVLTMNGPQYLAVGVDPIIDPCAGSMFYIAHDATRSTTGIVFDPAFVASEPCMVILDPDSWEWSLLKFEAVSRRFYPDDSWFGAISLDYVQAYTTRAISTLKKASDSTTYTPTSPVVPNFQFDYTSTSANVMVSTSTTVSCSFWISPTCTKQVSFATATPSTSFDLSQCGDLYEKGRFRCGLTDGFFELPSTNDDSRILAKRSSAFTSFKKWVHKVTRGHKSRGKQIREHFTDFSFAGNFTRAFYVIFTLVFATPLVVFLTLKYLEKKGLLLKRNLVEKKKEEVKRQQTYEIAATTPVSPTRSLNNIVSDY